jgi:hypothetical protein
MKSLESEKFTPDELAELHALPDDAMTKPEEALAGQPHCRALDLYVDRESKRRADALGSGMAHLAFLPG